MAAGVVGLLRAYARCPLCELEMDVAVEESDSDSGSLCPFRHFF